MTIGWVTDLIEDGELVEDSATARLSKKTMTTKLQAAAIILGSFLSGMFTPIRPQECNSFLLL